MKIGSKTVDWLMQAIVDLNEKFGAEVPLEVMYELDDIYQEMRNSSEIYLEIEDNY